MEQQDLHKRLMIALVLSFGVLVSFSYIFPQSEEAQQTQEKSASQMPKKSTEHQAPHIAADTAAPSTAALSTNTAPVTVSASPTAPTPVVESDIIATVKADDYILKIDRLGRVKSAQLQKEKYRDDDGELLELFDSNKILPLEVRFSDPAINKEAFERVYTASVSELTVDNQPQTIVLTQVLTSVTMTKKITFYPDGHYDLDISTDKKADFFLTPGHRPETENSMYMLVRGSLVRDSAGITTTVEDEDAEGSQVISNATIVSVFDRYNASLFYSFDAPFSVTMTADAAENPLPFVRSDQALRLHGYIGPKDWEVFKKIHPELVNAIEFGWFTFLSKPFFRVMLWIYSFVGNWGWSIILFTLLVKLILFPLSYKGMMSMQKLKDLAPKMKEIKERYGKDPAKMNQHMMDLYKKHGANPMGGCLPMLLQIPVFFALYRVLLNADELQGAEWISWIVDLSDKDPFYILPILMGASMYFQQKITPNSIADPMQQKIFKWFPVLMTFFFLTFPSGLVLYWLTNNILSIGQQFYINRAYEQHKLLVREEAKSDKKKD